MSVPRRKQTPDDQERIAGEALAMFVSAQKIPGTELTYPVVNPLKIPDASNYLMNLTGTEKPIDPFSRPDANAWTIVAGYLANSDNLVLALEFMLEYLRKCYELQLDLGRRIHKGGTHSIISEYYYQGDELDLARSHMLLAFIEDVVQYGDNAKSAPAWNYLTARFSMSPEGVDLLIERISSLGKDREILFPEDALISHLVRSRRRTPWLVLPFNFVYLKWKCKLLLGGKPDPSGQSLEMLMIYLFKTIPNLDTSWRELTRSGEFDVVVMNRGPFHEPLRWFGDYVLVECKDMARRVPVRMIEQFYAKLLITKIHTGIIVSRKGLSGRSELEHGRGLKHTIFSGSSIAVLDLPLREICEDVDSPSKFIELLSSKYEDVRFGRILKEKGRRKRKRSKRKLPSE